MDRRLGLIAGSGELPLAIAAAARDMGYTVTVVGLESITDPEISSYAGDVRWVNVGRLGALIDTLKQAGISKAVFAGKIHKSIIYEGKVIPDLKLVKLFLTLKDKSDDSIMLAITGALEAEGIRLQKTTDFTGPLMAPHGVLTKKKLSADARKDIEFGWSIAKEIGRLDIGQTVVIKEQAVMALEAIEGTDEAILRGGRLAGKGAVVIKVSKPEQDMRFDVPVVGIQTLRSMAAVKAGTLAIEAGKSILLNKEHFIREADKAGICVVGHS
ncbi:MAG: LpxI family protein [Nitrospirae bacterium]|nr:MAG: LpxI family protein [Nitrospirota bacterium]